MHFGLRWVLMHRTKQKGPLIAQRPFALNKNDFSLLTVR
jgi:hypothetical protein